MQCIVQQIQYSQVLNTSATFNKDGQDKLFTVVFSKKDNILWKEHPYKKTSRIQFQEKLVEGI